MATTNDGSSVNSTAVVYTTAN